MLHVCAFPFCLGPTCKATYTHSPCFPTYSLHLFNILNFSSLEELNGVKLSVGPSVSWVFGRNEKREWAVGGTGGERLEEEKGKRDWGQVHLYKSPAEPHSGSICGCTAPRNNSQPRQRDVKRWMELWNTYACNSWQLLHIVWSFHYISVFSPFLCLRQEPVQCVNHMSLCAFVKLWCFAVKFSRNPRQTVEEALYGGNLFSITNRMLILKSIFCLSWIL